MVLIALSGFWREAGPVKKLFQQTLDEIKEEVNAGKPQPPLLPRKEMTPNIDLGQHH